MVGTFDASSHGVCEWIECVGVYVKEGCATSAQGGGWTERPEEVLRPHQRGSVNDAPQQ